MGLGGLNWVSAYMVSEIEADTDAAMRAELAYPTTFRPFESHTGFAVSAAPYVFAAEIVSAHDGRLGSGLVDQSQKITVAARAMAERNAIGHLS